MQASEKILIPSDLFALYMLKNNLPLSAEYARDSDGSITCWTDYGIETWGNGATYEESREDLLKSLKEIADIIREQIQNGEDSKVPAIEKLYMLKILLSSDEELRKCLSCQNTEDF